MGPNTLTRCRLYVPWIATYHKGVGRGLLLVLGNQCFQHGCD